VIQNVPAGSVLDLGCWAGDPLARFLIKNGYFVTGIDGSQKIIELMSQKFPGENFFVGNYKKKSTLKLSRPFTFFG
jgi:2-polyprenyl-3-methyl-5-hydroxy-6-metoxy-1,4-benzoquinol methylase